LVTRAGKPTKCVVNNETKKLKKDVTNLNLHRLHSRIIILKNLKSASKKFAILLENFTPVLGFKSDIRYDFTWKFL